ncbi:GDSL esterase/lipase [Zea mays]|uniref:GDSL esterase/lipase n=1 Tax=Zea mays TaxID=4577 RepID=A0A1D6LE59_MAIZE|nr:GDSL esterase/lipase [Zea mays]
MNSSSATSLASAWGSRHTSSAMLPAPPRPSYTVTFPSILFPAPHRCANRDCRDDSTTAAGAVPPPAAISAFAFALSFRTLSAGKSKKHSRTGGYSGCRTMSSSLRSGRAMGTGQVSRNHLSSTGRGVQSSASRPSPPARLISDQVLNRCQNVVPSPTAWFSDMATKTPSASSVTCADSRGARESSSRAASVPSSPFSGKSDQTSALGT